MYCWTGREHQALAAGRAQLRVLLGRPAARGSIAAGYINGLQSEGVGACLKHFAANSQEDARMTTDSVVDARTLHEIYLTAFEQAVRESRPWTVMSAYNLVNGTYASEHRMLLAGSCAASGASTAW
jgi:beta-glucosidase